MSDRSLIALVVGGLFLLVVVLPLALIFGTAQ